MPPRSPRPTLFPYTTLFRSDGARMNAEPNDPARVLIHDHQDPMGPQRGRLAPEDRKSTRLNSSHEWTSYAVFCLKKKRNNPDCIRGNIPVLIRFVRNYECGD